MIHNEPMEQKQESSFPESLNINLLDPEEGFDEEQLTQLLQDVKRRAGDADALYKQEEARLMTEAAYLNPDNSEYDVNMNRITGDNPVGELYDTYGISVLDKLCNKAFTTLIPKNAQWFDVALENYVDTTDNVELQQWLSQQEAKIQNVLSSSNSNFKPAIGRLLYNFFCHGYAMCRIDPDWENKELEFRVCDTNAFTMEDSPSSKKVGTFFQAKYRLMDWNRDHPNMMIEGNGEREVVITFGTIPYRNYTMQMGEKFKTYKTWLQFVYKCNDTKFLAVNEITMDQNRFVLGRMQPPTNRAYPRGLGARILPTAQSLNKLGKTYLEITDWVGSPMFQADTQADLPPNFKPKPGAILYTNLGAYGDDRGSLRPLAVVNNAGNVLQAIQFEKEKLREIIDLVPSVQDVTQFRTATEWSIHQAKENETTGPLIDRFKEEVLIPLLIRVSEILVQMEVLEPEFKTKGNKFYRISVVGNEEQREKLRQLGSLGAMSEQMRQVGQLDPDSVIASINPRKWMKKAIRALSLDDIARTDKEAQAVLDQISQARQQAQEEQANMPPTQ